MYYVVEEILADRVRLELPDGGFMTVALLELPEKIREGDLLQKTENGFMIDAGATEQRREILAARTKSLFHRKDRS